MSDNQVKFGPILLAPGVKRSECAAYLYASTMLGVLQGFMSIIQPYVFTEQLGIPTSQQGSLVGNLAATQQAAVLIFVILFGALADRFGRRVFVLAAIGGMTTAMLVYPMAAFVIHLFVIRFFFGMASACNTAGAPAMRFDLTDNNSRGKILGLTMILHHIANVALVNWMGTRLPEYLATTQGLSAREAGYYTFLVIGLIGSVSMVVGYIFLRRDKPKSTERVDMMGIFKDSAKGLREVLAHAKVNPRFRLVLMASAVMRVEVTVITSFLALWVINAGRDQGLTSPEALRNYGTVAMFVAAADMCFTVLASWVADHVNRLKMLFISIGAVAIAMSMVLLVDDVTSWTLIAIVIIINLAESCQSVSSQALIGQETPAHLRGSSYGMIAWFGTVSVIIITLVCGYLVDLTPLGYRAPFLFMSVLASLFLVMAWIYLREKPAKVPAAAV